MRFMIGVLTLLLATAEATRCPSLLSIQGELQPKLSKGSSIIAGSPGLARWSDYGAPHPKFVVNVASESDVAATVKYCNRYMLPFVAQNGGNGWSNTFDLGSCGVTINIAALNHIVFNKDKTEATIGGGVTVQSMIDTGYANNARFANPTCPCLGFLGTSLGGGLTRMSGLYGWSVDQIVSATIVLASGEICSVSSTKRPDLFWAIRGAAPNFGIVTSAVVKSYPIPREQNIAWQGPIVFHEDKLEKLVTTIDNLKLGPRMQIDILLSNSGAPSYIPALIVFPFYLGTAAEAEKAFAPVLALEPLVNNATVIPYSQWSDWAVGFCTKGGRKPTFSASSSRLDPTSFRKVWSEYKTFLATHGADVGFSAILVEHYDTTKADQIGSGSSSYPYRSLSYHTVAIPWYQNASFDSTANAWGEKVRGLLRTDDGLAVNSTYINFAHGDETLQDIYGQSLPRLKKLKAQYDPYNRFNQWFPLA